MTNHYSSDHSNHSPIIFTSPVSTVHIPEVTKLVKHVGCLSIIFRWSVLTHPHIAAGHDPLALLSNIVNHYET